MPRDSATLNAPAADVTAEELDAYRAGRLPEPDAERVRDALAADPALADAFLALEAEAELEAAAAEVSAEEIAREWRAFETRLEPAGRVLPFRRFVSRHPLSSIAASFLIACLGTFFAARGFAPGGAGNVSILYEELEPIGAETVSRSTAHALEVAAENTEILLNLAPPPALELEHPLPETCRWELVLRAEYTLASGEAVLQDEGGYLVRLETGGLEPGDYAVLLSDPEGGDGGPFASYRFEVR